MNQTSRIYYLSKCKYVSDYMTKVKFKRIFKMKSYSQFKYLPKETKKAIKELQTYNCNIEYVIK